MDFLVQAFAQPGPAYRGKPFWSWNGSLETEELRRQLAVMQAMGLGGFFIHSRVGLRTPYLGAAWFDNVAAVVDEAAQLGLEAWLYDEDRWPSGGAGGLVTRDARYRKRMLFMDLLDDPADFRWSPRVLAAFTARIDGHRASAVRRVRLDAVPRRLAPGRTLLVFRWEIDDTSEIFNGGGYLDTLNPAAVREFIRVTHEAYRARVGAQFGGVIPGIFTDETSRGGMVSIWKGAYHAPWTESLPAYFQQRYGYDLLAHLPEVFFDVDGKVMTPARLHFHDAVLARFTEAYARQIGDWCSAHGLQFTGHFLAEETLSSQTATVGACMRLYEPMQIPGIDILTAQTRHIATAKQCASVARQLGRRWRITETYGVCGYDFSFAGNKAVGDWQVALGLNLRCQHLTYYTLEGEAKRDYPGTYSAHAPWWRHYPVVEDYFARLHVLMSQGEEVRDLLVIHPIESMWAQCKVGWDSARGTAAYDDMQVALENMLLARHLDFDYGDEEMLARLARVRRGEAGARLHVGEASYTAVLVPPLHTMRRSTLRLLRQFQAAGGTVVFAGEIAGYLEARPSAAIRAFAAQATVVPLEEAALANALVSTRRLSITDAEGQEIGAVQYLLRRDAQAYYLFLCNTGVDPRARTAAWINDPPVEARTAKFPEVTINGLPDALGMPQEWDPRTGERFTADAEWTGAGWTIRTNFAALGSRLFFIPHAAGGVEYPRRPLFHDVRRQALQPARWAVTRDQPNALVLDHARWQQDDGPWQEFTYILRIDRQVRAALGFSPRGNTMMQPWAQPACDARATVKLRYTISVTERPQGPLQLALEHPETAQVTLNGTPVDNSPSGCWLDHAFKTLPIEPALLQVGENTLEVCYTYTADHPGLEACYLLGDFGVQVAGADATLTAPPATLTLGDWTGQGLPFYAGNVSYETTITGIPADGERIFLRVPQYAGTAVHVMVNDHSAGVIAWEPNEVNITPWLSTEPAHIRIEVLGHPRNLLGPLHATSGGWASPEAFCADGANWSTNYQLSPLGLLAAPEIIIRRVQEESLPG